jgi:hypothetical protein
MNDLMERCEHCCGTGIIQTGSLAGNDCGNCVDGYILTSLGETFVKLVNRGLGELLAK